MDIVPLFPNKSVKIVKNNGNYVVMCLRREITPGVYSKYSVKKQTWYVIEICCTKFGYGNPGLWIASPLKKTLFYGNYFSNPGKGYLKRSFYTGEYSTLLVGLLVKNATNKSGFILEKLKITEMPVAVNEDVLFNKEDEEYIENNFSNSNLEELQELLEDDAIFKSTENSDEEEPSEEPEIEEPEIVFTNAIPLKIPETKEEIITEKQIYSLNSTDDDFEVHICVFTSLVGNNHIYPISFGIPDEYVEKILPEKEFDFFPQVIGKSVLSNYKQDVNKYYDDLGKSRFILVSKNEFGDDNPVYYEALAKGCIPFIVNDIDKYTSVFLPKEILEAVKKADGVDIGCIDANKFSYAGYSKIANFLLNYTRDNLTTEHIANYLLKITKKEVKNVLFLSNAVDGSDFLLQQSLIHGLKKKLGSGKVVDFPRVTSMYKNTEKSNNEVRFSLPYGYLLEKSNVSRGRIEKRIEHKEFDIIIIMGIFTEKDKQRLNIKDGEYPYYDVINKHYMNNEILFIDGNNVAPRFEKYFNKGICFRK